MEFNSITKCPIYIISQKNDFAWKTSIFVKTVKVYYEMRSMLAITSINIKNFVKELKLCYLL